MMKRVLILWLAIFITQLGFGQTILLIQGKDTTVNDRAGYNIPRSTPTLLQFRNNKVVSIYGKGPIIGAGDNDYSVTNSTNLNNAEITGNHILWRASSSTGSTHGIMAGYNEGYNIGYNFFDSTQYGVTHEGGYPDHSSMSDTTGKIYYNIFKNINYNVINKGYDGTRIVGNTFYTNLNEFSTFIGVKESDTGGITAPYPNSANVKIFNNIFYNAGTTLFPAISVGTITDDTPAEMDTVGFECDYNIYYYENRPGNEPYFSFNGVGKTWAEWRALGYDTHSIIVDPEFIDFINFVPGSRDIIEVGVNLGSEFQEALSTTATWVPGVTPDKETQGTIWQVGARIYATEVIHHADFYVATDGNDSNPGTYEQPWATWGKAFNSTAVQPGDTVYIRGGVYSMTSNDLAYPHTAGEGYNLGRDGTAGNYIHYFNYPGETPILDCSNVTPASNHNRAIYGNSDVNYLHFRGLTVRNVYQIDGNTSVTGWGIVGNNNIIENCVVYNCGGKGFFGAGHNIYYINCDAYNNSDSLTYEMPGNDGVGFTNVDVSQDDGSVYYINCRAWENGDQGFSAISNGYLEFNGCWSFNNGDLQGEGHGFKMGAVGIYPDQPDFGPLKRKYVNCIAAYNRANGWTTNDSDTPTRHQEVHRMHIYNNLSFFNGHHLSDPWPPMQYGFVIYKTASDASLELAREYYNNISIGNEDGDVFIHSYPPSNPVFASYTHSNNSWDGGVTVTLDDFAAVPVNKEAGVTLLMGTRQSDGSLPDLGNYFKLAQGSDAIDAGINVGLPYKGLAPDLGPFESDYGSQSETNILSFSLSQQTGPATINTTNHTVTIQVAYGTNVTSLTPSITVSTGATISPASGETRNFSNPVTYTVSNSGVSQTWTVTVTVASAPPQGDSDSVLHQGRPVYYNGRIVRIG